MVVLLGGAVLLELLVAQAGIKLAPNELVLIEDCQINTQFEEKGSSLRNTYRGLIHFLLNLVRKTVFLNVVTNDTKWAPDKNPVHHVGKLAVIALRNIFDDLDGMSDGSIMAKEACV